MSAGDVRDAAGALPDDLAQTIRGFQDSRAILTAIELDAFTAVAEGTTGGQAAAKMGTDPRAATMHTAHLWHRWSTLTDCVRQGAAIARREPREVEDRWTRPFIAAMHRNARERAPHAARGRRICHLLHRVCPSRRRAAGRGA
ncbi:MAG: hypothetical protein ABSF64_09575 [Bryobacteraceae bacterium]